MVDTPVVPERIQVFTDSERQTRCELENIVLMEEGLGMEVGV